MLCQEAGRGAVGGDHEVGDQVLRPVLPVGAQIHQFTVDEYRPGLGRRHVQRTTLLAPLAQAAGRLVVQPQLSLQRRIRGDGGGGRRLRFEPSCHAVVVELVVIAHRSAV